MHVEVSCTLSDGLPVFVVGHYTFGCSAQLSGPPEVCYPEESSEFEFDIYWPPKRGEKKLYPCRRKLTDEDIKRVHKIADNYVREV